MMKLKSTFLITLLLAFLLSACEPSSPTRPNDIAEQTVAEEDLGLSEDELNVVELDAVDDCLPPCVYPRNAINDPDSPLVKRLIFFDFDQVSIKPEYIDLINQHAKYLQSNIDVKVRLEGHSDERGSREYNVALAEKRALSVRRLLLLQGVKADNVNIVSFGEELPLDMGRDEAAWAQNRRVEFIYDAN